MNAFNSIPDGQNHDRFVRGGSKALSSSLNMAPPLPEGPGDVDVEISALQKIVSAISGSLLTSLLGTCSTKPGSECIDIWRQLLTGFISSAPIVTPLDVVRVRWQSQNVQ